MRCPLCNAKARLAESWDIYGPTSPTFLLCSGPVRHVTSPVWSGELTEPTETEWSLT